MDSKVHNPAANVPKQSDEGPRGDRGHGDRTWAPAPDQQGISNRPGDPAQSLAGSAGPEALRHEDVIEDVIEREENRNAENEVQESLNSRTRRKAQVVRFDR